MSRVPEGYLREAAIFMNDVGPQKVINLIFEAHNIVGTEFGFKFLRELYGKNKN